MVLMPDHLHAVVGFGREDGLKRVVVNWKTFLAKRIGVKWQRDFFDHRLRNETEVKEKWEYALMNPVRKGLCERVEDWRWVWSAHM